MMTQFRESDENDERVLAVAAQLRPELTREAESGFPLLNCIPSTGVIRFLDHFAKLPTAEHAAFLDGLAHLGALNFFPAPLIVRAHERLRNADTSRTRFFNNMANAREYAYGLRYLDLRMHRAAMNDPQSVAQMAQTRAKLDFVPRDDLPERLVGTAGIRDIQPAKAPLLRKLLNKMAKARLGATAQKRPGGELVYEGTVADVPLRLSIIFSNRFAQLHWGLDWALRERNLSVRRLTYELLWGSNTGWDYLTEDNAARSIDLLGELLVVIARLFSRVVALPMLG
jgi:hypothetical protein